MNTSGIVIIPPLLVIASVILTRRMIVSFLIGIVSSALIATNGSLIETTILTGTKLWHSSGLENLKSVHTFWGSWNLLTFIFLIMLGILIVLLTKTGAAQAYVNVVQKRVHSKKSVEIASLLLSFLFFIDDYFSALTVGSVMRPLAQLYNVHPLKMAFLTTVMASPLTILSPLSSWIGEIVPQLRQVGINSGNEHTVILADPYFAFIKTIPYNAYPLILIISTWYIVIRRISFGPMKQYEKTHSFVTSGTDSFTPSNKSLFDFLFPIILLITVVFLMALYTGNAWVMGGTEGFAEAIKQASMHQALFTGGLVSITCSSLYFISTKTITTRTFLHCVKKGFNLMFPSIIMLICAWSLGSILKNELKTGSYIAGLLSNHVTLELFPALCFLFSTFVACMIGSAWATIGLMFPLIIDMLQKLLSLGSAVPLDSVPLILPVLGATLSGCILGTHFSFLSDNPIMSSASTGASHVEHLKTMAWYIIPIAVATGCNFMLMGFLLPYFPTTV
ncbi:hypothetical protein H0X06_05395, partial [Candidatus Dependentiae bacterium]|nr:hypothetical protein [Candidatus Dependentiae bacterium]